MRAHQLDENGKIINTIVVPDLDWAPNLIDADLGGQVGDTVVDGVITKNPVDPDEADFIANKAEYFAELREERDKVLSRLNGISATLFLREPPALTEEKAACLLLIQALLDITTLPSVLAATTRTELKAAAKAEYARLVAVAHATSTDLVNAFRKVDA